MLVVLNQDISFLDTNDQPVMFRKGSMLYVDPANLIAYASGLHFTVDRHEFTPVQ